MEQAVYERPREKLRNKGASALTTIELLQLVIGSGSSGISGAKLARHVEEVLTRGSASVSELTALTGIGEAKACQVLASLELGSRMVRYGE